MSVPKWTDDRTEALRAFVADETPVSQATVAEAAEQFETSTRSVSSKLRKMGYEVESAAVATSKKFSDDEEATLRAFVEGNSGEYTYAQIAEHFANGKFTAKQVQGKILAMELTSSVKPTPKPESQRTYSDDEEAKVVSMINDGKFVEEIAEALGREVPSIRGKALSLLRSERITEMPKQRDVKEAPVDPLTALGDISEMTVEEIAEKIEKTARGVKTMLTRRGLTAADYNGAKKKAAASE